MLNFIYYPVSAVLAVWHSVFGFVFGPASGLAWILAVVFLVLTFRAVLFLPFLKQARTQAVIARIRPEMKKIQQQYKADRIKQSTELQKLYQENGISALATLLTMVTVFAQLLLFLGLFHVLRSFDRTEQHTNLPFLSSGRMTPEQNAATPNYVFGADDVQSFLHAKILGVPLSTAMATAGDLVASVALVAVPLMLIAAVATHFTARTSMTRQDSTAIPFMRPLSLWLFPAMALVGGMVMPVAILLYFVTNNACTFAQQHLVYRRLDADERQRAAAAAQRTAEIRASNTPKPGARPKRVKNRT
ncbi:membrane protein insertase YidC [Nocardia arthritidis]|uniref:Membrane protein insertase YidC n=1 Tax=Nocardia arthritidis TaxID=228602 RepID=A0A6G9YJC5_9NOCA|nr:membrane protein insertase YidC [Nocardia arthritidis]QIS13167.1 membrane protein insertase YidC [Nocardia arthritidis]